MVIQGRWHIVNGKVIQLDTNLPLGSLSCVRHCWAKATPRRNSAQMCAWRTASIPLGTLKRCPDGLEIQAPCNLNTILSTYPLVKYHPAQTPTQPLAWRPRLHLLAVGIGLGMATNPDEAHRRSAALHRVEAADPCVANPDESRVCKKGAAHAVLDEVAVAKPRPQIDEAAWLGRWRGRAVGKRRLPDRPGLAPTPDLPNDWRSQLPYAGSASDPASRGR